jgi:hypothetical protein
MNRKSLVFVTLLLSSGAALAKPAQDIDTVEVRPLQHEQMVFACANPAKPATADVERLLGIVDHSQTFSLRNQLMGAVGEACNAGLSNIVVSRAEGSRDLRWRAAREYEASVALR